MQKLWQKNWSLNKFIEIFETQGDLLLDQKLVKFDVMGSIAHALGLQKIGFLSKKETHEIIKKLRTISELNNQKKFDLAFGDEDVHTKIESYLTMELKDLGKKVHTGRSRNDQVLTAIRLFTKEYILNIWSELLQFQTEILQFTNTYEWVALPGYTHMQKAMPSTVGMWSAALFEACADDLTILKTAYLVNNQSPLGSAAGYGVPLQLDRTYTAKILGFCKVQNNSLYCQNSRGKIEGAVLSSLASIMQSINKFASDVLLFSTSEFHFFDIHPTVCSGSSIMPQKKNVDVAELLRSKVHVVLGNYIQVMSLSSNLISGYNRDLQDSKKPLFESLELTLSCLQIARILLRSLTVNKDHVSAAMSSELFATHLALKYVKDGIPFRDAYKKAANEYMNVPIQKNFIQASPHIGGTGNLGIKKQTRLLKKEKMMFDHENKKYQKVIDSLLLQKGIYE